MEPPSKRARGEEYNMLTLRQCAALLKPLTKADREGYFLVPVPWQALNLHDYPTIIQYPMDLGTIDKKLVGGSYVSVDDFVADVRLVFNNCRLYNQAGDPVGIAGAKLSELFEKQLKEKVEEAGSTTAALKRGNSGIKRESFGDGPGGDAAPAASVKAEAEYGLPFKAADAILKAMKSNANSSWFRKPIDPAWATAAGYFDVIKNPMDIETVQNNLKAGQYATVGDLRRDLDLIWDNAVLYNNAESVVGQQAIAMRTFMEKKFLTEGNLPDDAPVLAAPGGGASGLGAAAARAARGGSGGGGRGGRGGGGSTRGPRLVIPKTAPPPLGIIFDPEAQRMAEEADAAPKPDAKDVMLTMKQCTNLLTPLKTLQYVDMFLQPVDPVALNLPDYTQVITKPMDLGTIEGKLNSKAYTSPGEFVDDMRLVWANARKYNPPGSLVHQAAVFLRNVFERNLWMMMKKDMPVPAAVAKAALEPPKTQRPVVAPPPAPADAGAGASSSAAEPGAYVAPAPAPPPPPARTYSAAPARPKKAAAQAFVPKAAAPALPAAAGTNPYEPTGAEAVTQKYTKVIKFLRTHHAGVYFKNPVDPVKMNIPQYFDVIKNPMDLKTVLNKLEDRQYPDAASLRADVDLIWDNAILFNGEESWMKKHIDTMRPLAARKFDEAARKKERLSVGFAGGAMRRDASFARPAGPGNVLVDPNNDYGYFITPQMRLTLLESAIKLADGERVQLGKLAKQLCPDAVKVTGEDGRETMIDIDAIDPKSFLKLDMHVRRRRAQMLMDENNGSLPGPSGAAK